jgi:hypothetical protein
MIEIEPDDLGPTLIREEFDDAIGNIHDRKATGNGEMHIELIKHANNVTLMSELFELTCEMYNIGQILKDFKTTITVTKPKKSSTVKCEE